MQLVNSRLLARYTKARVLWEVEAWRVYVGECKVQSGSRAYLLQAPPPHILLPLQHTTTC